MFENSVIDVKTNKKKNDIQKISSGLGIKLPSNPCVKEQITTYIRKHFEENYILKEAYVKIMWYRQHGENSSS